METRVIQAPKGFEIKTGGGLNSFNTRNAGSEATIETLS